MQKFWPRGRWISRTTEEQQKFVYFKNNDGKFSCLTLMMNYNSSRRYFFSKVNTFNEDYQNTKQKEKFLYMLRNKILLDLPIAFFYPSNKNWYLYSKIRYAETYLCHWGNLSHWYSRKMKGPFTIVITNKTFHSKQISPYLYSPHTWSTWLDINYPTEYFFGNRLYVYGL